MRQCLTCLVLLLLAFAWPQVSASLDLDFETSPNLYYSDDTLLTSTETSQWSDRDGGDWSTDPELNSEPTSELNPELNNADLFVDASSNRECVSSDAADQLQMATGKRRLRKRGNCPNALFQKLPSSQDSLNQKFLETLPIFTMYTYKEPDPNLCPEDLFGHFIYPVCGSSSEEAPFPDGININPCNPCTPAFFTESRGEEYA